MHGLFPQWEHRNEQKDKQIFQSRTKKNRFYQHCSRNCYFSWGNRFDVLDIIARTVFASYYSSVVCQLISLNFGATKRGFGERANWANKKWIGHDQGKATNLEIPTKSFGDEPECRKRKNKPGEIDRVNMKSYSPTRAAWLEWLSRRFRVVTRRRW